MHKAAAIALTVITTAKGLSSFMNRPVGRDWRKRERERLNFLERNCTTRKGKERCRRKLSVMSMYESAVLASIVTQSAGQIAAIRATISPGTSNT